LQSHDCCRGTFGVWVFDHDAAKYFGGIEILDPWAGANAFVGGEAAAGVLHREQDFDGVEEALVGD
jgi:hypothetical protein